MSRPLFHLAFPVTDLPATREFYTQLLGCGVGRESQRWIDFDFAGHQITAHLCDAMPGYGYNQVDGKQVRASHFGLILDWQEWHTLADRLQTHNATFVIEPYIRFEGLPGEQATMFVEDPSGNHLEFKAFKNVEQLFATSLNEA